MLQRTKSTRQIFKLSVSVYVCLSVRLCLSVFHFHDVKPWLQPIPRKLTYVWHGTQQTERTARQTVRQNENKGKKQQKKPQSCAFCAAHWHSTTHTGEAGLEEEIHKSGSGRSGKTKGNSNKLSQVLFGKTRRPTVPQEQELHPHKPIADIIAFSRLTNATSFPASARLKRREGGGRVGWRLEHHI